MGNDSSHEEEEEEEPKPGSLTGRPISKPVRHVQIHKVHFDVPSKKWKSIRSSRRSSEASPSTSSSRDHYGFVKLLCKDFIVHKPYVGDMYFYHLYYETPKKEVYDIQGYYLPNKDNAINWFFQDVFIYGLVITGDGLDLYIQLQIDAHIDNIENQLLLEEKNGESVGIAMGRTGLSPVGVSGGGTSLGGIEMKSVVEGKNVRLHAQSMGFAGIATRNMKLPQNDIIIDDEDIIGNPIPIPTPMITPVPLVNGIPVPTVESDGPIGPSLTLKMNPSGIPGKYESEGGVDTEGAGAVVEEKKTDFSESADGSVEVVVDKVNE